MCIMAKVAWAFELITEMYKYLTRYKYLIFKKLIEKGAK